MRLSLLVFMLALAANAQVIKGFVTDGCTMYPDGTSDNPTLWYHCCLEHDLRYWVGGDKEDQKIADLKLKQCVRKVSTPFRAELMYRGIRLGHLSPIKSKYKWGWGWRHPKKFTPLTREEKAEVLRMLEPENINPRIKEKFISENLLIY
jgi:hypothetical protein